MRYAYAITGALLLGGTAIAVTTASNVGAQVAQNEGLQAAAPAGAPASLADMVEKLQILNNYTPKRGASYANDADFLHYLIESWRVKDGGQRIADPDRWPIDLGNHLEPGHALEESDRACAVLAAELGWDEAQDDIVLVEWPERLGDEVPAGALRIAMTQTAPDAEVIGVLDADYVVQPTWLKDLVPLFADPKVGLIQAPQDHRDGGRSVMHHVMNGEYAGFFDIGMVQRNEANAIIVHGTMCLIRRAALDDAGNWSSDTICEDTDLGLTVLELGWTAHYTNRRYGHGLLPDTYLSYKRQRNRWAYGGFQILKKHWKRFLPGANLLTREQKREFTLGWLNWLGAESVGVVVAFLNLIWVPVVAYFGIAVPDKILTIPILATFAVSLAHFFALYRLRVRIPVSQMLGAAVTAMSVQWTVARAVADGLVKDHLPFVVTAKGGSGRRGPDFPAFWEAVIGALLVIGAIWVYATNHERVREINLFALVLVVQSLPFLASVLLAALEGSRLNNLAAWRTLDSKARALQGKAGELLSRRPTLPVIPALPTIADAPAVVADKQVETVQS